MGDLDVTVPAIGIGEQAVGLQSLDFAGTGASQEDMGIYANLGPVDYGSGCGADEEGGGGGCSATGTGFGRSFLTLLLFIGAIIRRRV